MKLIYAICGVLLANSASAVPDVLVSSVQMPAWVERDAQRFPVSPGMSLNSNDVLITGSGARLLLKSADGSDIKLGENARMLVSNMAKKQDGQTMFTASLNVLQGAFRFTTAAFAKLRPRNISVKVSGATIGIRGTDVWGKSGGRMRMDEMEKAMGKPMGHPGQEMLDFDVVCLIEGKIEVKNHDETPFMMEQPVTFYVMPKKEAAIPVSPLAMEQLNKWAAETEIVAGQGATATGGKWKVILLTAANETAALAAYDEWRNAGYAIKILPVNKENTLEYQLRIGQLATRTEALALAKSLSGKFGASNPSVSR
jgi:hypothetical protein